MAVTPDTKQRPLRRPDGSASHRFIWTVRAGRIGGIYTVGLTGGIVIGTPIGGLLAKSFGITAPFWFGFVGSAILVTVLWREFRHIAHDPRAADAQTA